MLVFILEAALRSAIMAAIVWSGIRVLRVRNVLAQKIAWALVLLGAVIMPLAMRAPFLPATTGIEIPLHVFSSTKVGNRVGGKFQASQPVESRVSSGLGFVPDVRLRELEVSGVPIPTPELLYEPSAAKRLSRIREFAIGKSEGYLKAGAVNVHDLKPTSDRSITESSRSGGLPITSLTSSNPSISHSTIWKTSIWNSSILTTSLVRSILYLIYITIAGLLVFRTILALSLAYRIWKRSFPISAEGLEIAPGQLNSTAPLQIRVSNDLSSPATVGSTVLLPADYAEWDEAKLRIVLAHELSHVHQKDFYLQLAAAIHASIFWFSPLGWWLKSKLSDLGEALSDRAGLQQADSPYSYAQILLEFAAKPHQPVAGVAMARSSNISNRIDRIINNQVFRLAFLRSRRHALVACVLAPLALIAVVCGIRIVPEVEAAQSRTAVTTQSSTQSTNSTTESSTSNSDSVTNNANRTGQVSITSSDQVVSTNSVPANSSESRQVPPVPVGEPPVAPEQPEENDLETPEPPTPPEPAKGFGVTYSFDDSDRYSFAIVGDKDSNVTINGRHSKEFEEARAKYHHNFIWFERDGKSYVITDPAIVAQGTAMFNFDSDPRMKLRQEELQKMQSKLDAEMKNLQPEIEKASLPGPEFQEQVAKLNAELAQLQSEKFKHLDEQIAKAMKDSGKVDQKEIQEITQEKLGELSEKMGEIQGQIGEIQGKIGEREGLLGEKQGEIGERMGKVGEEMGRIGEEQGRRAEEASRKIQSILDQAVKDGKAKPID